MNNDLKKEWPLILFVLIPFLYLGYIWNSLPDKVPIHWNAEGNVNGWGNKSALIIIPLLLPLLTYIIFWITPLIDPKRKLQFMGEKFYQLKFGVVLLMSLLALFILYSAKNRSLLNPNIVPMFIGLLFAFLGSYMPSIQANYFIGIRTPWTLENESVWRKTHQLAGKLWTPGGVMIIFLSFVIKDAQLMHTVFMTITGIIVIIPMIYSYLIYKKEAQHNS